MMEIVNTLFDICVLTTLMAAFIGLGFIIGCFCSAVREEYRKKHKRS